MSPLSKKVEEAGIRGMHAKRDPDAIHASDFFETSESVRALFAGLIGAEKESIAIIPAASYGIATAARNMSVARGQSIVVVDEQFPSNFYSWLRLAEETGAELRTVSPPQTVLDRGKIWNERILAAIDSRTAVVALAHVHWADGTLFDLEAIGARARDVDAALIVDGTQSVGALPFDVRRIQPDAMICAGYKWLMGPYGCGLAYYGPRFMNGTPLEENWITRKNSENFGGLVRYTSEYQEGAVRFDVGERSNFILLPMLEAALEQLIEWDISRIQGYCGALTGDFIRQASAYGFEIENSAWRANHLFGIRVRSDIPMERLMNSLREKGVSVSVRGTAIRISPHVYNDAVDVGALADVIEKAARAT